jgi:hypothetical protein
LGGAQAVYFEAEAEERSGVEGERRIPIYSRRSVAHGAGEWQAADVIAPAPHRLYSALASQVFVLAANDQRIPVELSQRS